MAIRTMAEAALECFSSITHFLALGQEKKYEKACCVNPSRTSNYLQRRLTINLFAVIILPLSLKVFGVFIGSRIDSHHNAAFFYA